MEAISVEQKPGRKRRYTAAHFRHIDRHRADDTGHSRTLASGKRAAALGHVRPSRFRRRDAQVVEGPGGYHQPWKPYGHTEIHASTLDPATSASATVAQVQLPSRVRKMVYCFSEEIVSFSSIESFSQMFFTMSLRKLFTFGYRVYVRVIYSYYSGLVNCLIRVLFK